MIYILAAIISASLATAQALWGSAVKAISAKIQSPGVIELIANMIQNWKFWAGAGLYVMSTGLYFMLLSKAKFFSVQITMTGVAAVMAILISTLVFQEKITLVNVAGIVLIFIGVYLIMQR